MEELELPRKNPESIYHGEEIAVYRDERRRENNRGHRKNPGHLLQDV